METVGNSSFLPIDYQNIIDLSNNTMPICKTTQEYNGTFYQILQDSSAKCPKMCASLIFRGELARETGSFYDPRHSEIFFWFASNETQVHTEYLVFDTNGLIGSIGGSLGLFIGFSFHGAMISILAFMKNILIRSKIVS